MDKLRILLAVLILLVWWARFSPITTSTKKSTTFTVYGTSWCGYTTKQRKHLDSKYGKKSHKYVDCDGDMCPPGITSFPVTVTGDGTKVVGFNTEL